MWASRNASTTAVPPSSAFPPDINNSEECEDGDNATDPDKQHELEAGDHIVRWTHIALYPIQVHGIVLSAGPGLVTLVDFGIASQSKSADRKFGPTDDATNNADAAATSTDREAREVSRVAGANGGDRRLEIITITDEKEINRWRKVDYGATLSAGNKFQRLMSSILPGGKKNASKSEPASAAASRHDESESIADSKTASAAATTAGDSSSKTEKATETEKVLRSAEEGAGQQNEVASLVKTTADTAATDYTTEEATEAEAPKTPPSLPKSDPKGIVLARVRYLLEHEGVGKNGQHCNSVLPPYHLFNANSECIAVWCKTGRFSTLQAAIFLHTTAIGQAKSAATLSLFVASQTVPMTVTVPAGGILGWFGMTTTTTTMVPMLIASPWLIPALAGYGLAAVGTPYLILIKAKGKWEESTKELNDGFWEWAGPDVYVDAIRGWGGLTYQ